MKKKLKRILSALLVAVMLVGIAPIGGIDLSVKSSAMDLSSYKVGDLIEFGSYPQSEVTDSNLISKIESAGANISWIDYNYYAGTGKSEDGNMKSVKDMMLYKDITYGGNKYRAVKINQYRPSKTGDTIPPKIKYQYLNGYHTGNTYYFKYEPLIWRVLDPSEGYVMCNQIIDSQAYQDYIYYNDGKYYNSMDCTNYASDWTTSSLRGWLNENFYNTSFTDNQKAQILTTHNENKCKGYYSTYNSADTYDKIFPITYFDARNSEYGYASGRRVYDTARKLYGTDYALCQGLEVETEPVGDGTSPWWLRTPDSDFRKATIVEHDGNEDSAAFVGLTKIGVVPALKFNPKSTIPEKSDEEVFHENSYIVDIWLSRNREETSESKFIKSMLEYGSVSTVIYDDLKNKKDFQNAVNLWTGMKVIFDPEKGLEDIYLSEEGLYETLIFDLVKKIMYDQNEDTGNVIIDAANKADSTVSKVTKYKGYIDKIKTITVDPDKNLLNILKEWKFDPKSDSFSKFYGMLNDIDQASSKWTDNKFIEGIGTIADISSDVAEFYKRLTSYIMLEDMSEETVALLKALKEQTENEAFKKALGNAINAYNDIDTVSVVCTMKLAQDTALDVGGAFFDDLAKCSQLYSTYRVGYKVGVALCNITLNTSKAIDAYKICGATKEFINANKSAINVLANKYLTSKNDFDAGVYVNAIRAYRYAFEIDMENGVEFVKKADTEGLINKKKNIEIKAVYGLINMLLNTNLKTNYETIVRSKESISNGLESLYTDLNNTWKFDMNYLRSDYPDIFPVYVKKEISQSQYAPNITSAYIDKSGKTMLTWSRPGYFRDSDGKIYTLHEELFDGIYATETVGGSKNTYDNDNINEAPSTIEFYNASKFKTFNKDYTLAAYTDTTGGKVYSAAKKISVGNPLLKAEIRVASASEAGSAQVMFSIIDDTSSRYDSLKYTIYRKADGGSWTKIDDIARETARFNGKLTLYKDTTAKKGQKYSYKVVSHMTFDNGMTLNSPESSVVSVIGGVGMKKLDINVRDHLPQIRTRGTNEEKQGIELSWTKTANADGYEIYRITSYGTVYQLIKTVGKDTVSYVDYDVDAGTTYNYMVCPYVNNGEKVYDLSAVEQGSADYKVAKIYSVDVSDIKLNYKKSTTITPSITADEGAKYTVKYSSSNTKVATVDENGKVYAAKKGGATITCTVTDSNGNTVSDTCKVTVKYSFGQWLIKILLFGWIWY